MNTERITIRQAGTAGRPNIALEAGSDRPMPACTGEGVDGDHCCYVGGIECQFLRRDAAGRKFACGLMIDYGVPGFLESEEYNTVGEQWEALNLPYNYCYTFSPAFCCRPEYRDGRPNDAGAR